jgi:hypothetical protein
MTNVHVCAPLTKTRHKTPNRASLDVSGPHVGGMEEIGQTIVKCREEEKATFINSRQLDTCKTIRIGNGTGCSVTWSPYCLSCCVTHQPMSEEGWRRSSL